MVRKLFIGALAMACFAIQLTPNTAHAGDNKAKFQQMLNEAAAANKPLDVKMYRIALMGGLIEGMRGDLTSAIGCAIGKNKPLMRSTASNRARKALSDVKGNILFMDLVKKTYPEKGARLIKTFKITKSEGMTIPDVLCDPVGGTFSCCALAVLPKK